MAKVTFKVKKPRSNQEFMTVFLRYTHQYQEFSKAVGQVAVKSWDKKRKWVNGNDPVSIKTRNIMFKCKDYAEGMSGGLSIEDKALLMDAFIKECKGEGGDELQAKVLPQERLKTLCDYIDEFIAIHKKKYVYNVIRKYGTVKRNIQLFCDKYKYKDEINRMTKDDQTIFFSKFIDFLCYDVVHEEDRRIKKRYFNETVMEDVKHIKAVCNYFDSLDLRVNLSKLTEYLKTPKNPMPYCTVNEIMVIYNYNDFDEHPEFFEAVRDCCVFQAFTGLRHNELYNVTRDNIATLMVDGEQFKVLSHVPNKTKDRNNVPLNNICLEIIEKWSKKEFESPSKYDKKTRSWTYFDKCLLPVKCNQQSNKFLHKLCKKIGLNENHSEVKYSGSDRFETVRPKHEVITTHAMRHSFAYHLKEKGYADGEIADLMGITESTFRDNYRHTLGKESTYKTFKSLNVEVLGEVKSKAN